MAFDVASLPLGARLLAIAGILAFFMAMPPVEPDATGGFPVAVDTAVALFNVLAFGALVIYLAAPETVEAGIRPLLELLP